MVPACIEAEDAKPEREKGDGKRTIEGCLDTCWVGPTIAVEPDHFFYGRVTEADIEEIVDALERGARVERLVLKPDDFVEPAELKKQGKG